ISFLFSRVQQVAQINLQALAEQLGAKVKLFTKSRLVRIESCSHPHVLHALSRKHEDHISLAAIGNGTEDPARIERLESAHGILSTVADQHAPVSKGLASDL